MAPIEPRDFMLYWGVTIFVLLVVLFGRPRRRGVRLRLLGGARAARGLTTVDDDRTPSPAEIRGAPTAPPERRLNVVFQFNGESWDAYEVLGLPAGSNFDSVRAAYLESLESVDASSRPFVEAAYRAIADAQRG